MWVVAVVPEGLPVVVVIVVVVAVAFVWEHQLLQISPTWFIVQLFPSFDQVVKLVSTLKVSCSRNLPLYILLQGSTAIFICNDFLVMYVYIYMCWISFLEHPLIYHVFLFLPRMLNYTITVE